MTRPTKPSRKSLPLQAPLPPARPSESECDRFSLDSHFWDQVKIGSMIRIYFHYLNFTQAAFIW